VVNSRRIYSIDKEIFRKGNQKQAEFGVLLNLTTNLRLKRKYFKHFFEIPVSYRALNVQVASQLGLTMIWTYILDT